MRPEMQAAVASLVEVLAWAPAVLVLVWIAWLYRRANRDRIGPRKGKR